MVSMHSPFERPAVRILETRLVSVPIAHAQLTAPRDAAVVIDRLIGDADREHFVALYLNARHEITHAHVVSCGTVQSAPVHPREVFKGALLANASAIVVGHNHPSGDVNPSPEDERIVDRLRSAGELMGVEVLDSLIVGPSGRFYTAADNRVFPLPAEALEVADGPD